MVVERDEDFGGLVFLERDAADFVSVDGQRGAVGEAGGLHGRGILLDLRHGDYVDDALCGVFRGYDLEFVQAGGTVQADLAERHAANFLAGDLCRAARAVVFFGRRGLGAVVRVRAGILACRSAAFRGLALSPLASFRRQYRDVALDLDVEGFLGARFAVVTGVRQDVAEAGVEFFAEVVLDDVVYRIAAELVDGFEIAGVIRRSLFFPFVVLRVLEVAQDSIEFPLHEEDAGKGDERAEVVLLEACRVPCR